MKSVINNNPQPYAGVISGPKFCQGSPLSNVILSKIISPTFLFCSNLNLSIFEKIFIFTGNDCSKAGDDYFGNDLNQCGDKKDTNHECQKLCQQTVGCLQFTWIGYGTVGREKECCLKNAINNNPEFLSTVISGPQSCGMVQYYSTNYF